MALIERLKQQLRLTSVVVTHDTKLAKRVADRIVFLEDGRVVFFGTSGELAAHSDAQMREFFREDELPVVME